jgi:hypothetical protein
MAQTRKKRRTKHRGNAAGAIEARGRTGRRPTAAERKQAVRKDRFSKPPTWRGAANRALVAVGIFVAIVILLFHQKVAAAIALGGAMLLIYIPMGYYMDMYFYRRRQAKLAGGDGPPKER